MLDPKLCESDDPRVSALLAAAALGREHPEHAEYVLRAVAPGAPSTTLVLAGKLVDVLEDLHADSWAKQRNAAARHYGNPSATKADLAALRDAALGEVKGFLRYTLAHAFDPEVAAICPHDGAYLTVGGSKRICGKCGTILVFRDPAPVACCGLHSAECERYVDSALRQPDDVPCCESCPSLPADAVRDLPPEALADGLPI